jgi:hypothetical protein
MTFAVWIGVAFALLVFAILLVLIFFGEDA